MAQGTVGLDIRQHMRVVRMRFNPIRKFGGKGAKPRGPHAGHIAKLLQENDLRRAHHAGANLLQGVVLSFEEWTEECTRMGALEENWEDDIVGKSNPLCVDPGLHEQSAENIILHEPCVDPGLHEQGSECSAEEEFLDVTALWKSCAGLMPPAHGPTPEHYVEEEEVAAYKTRPIDYETLQEFEVNNVEKEEVAAYKTRPIDYETLQEFEVKAHTAGEMVNLSSADDGQCVGNRIFVRRTPTDAWEWRWTPRGSSFDCD